MNNLDFKLPICSNAKFTLENSEAQCTGSMCSRVINDPIEQHYDV